ncbi:AAA family ATPase [Synechococcus sp. PCC 7336]|uniref:AAA family ATPase n=1 Tax=Synechococcus sp. PCC 7336 TaxID=195250 RepID=UPI00034D23C2|nr:AAA family ATPase [Synechococcus sp. PCC 7336]
MSLTNSIHDLKTLVRSFHPIVTIATSEEERVRSLLSSVASDLHIQMFEWSVTRGLTRPPREVGVNGTEEPLKLLAHLETLPHEGVYLLKDFAQSLTDPVIVRLFREIAQQFSHNRSTLVLTANELNLPCALESLAMHWELPLPDYHELRGVLRSVVGALKTSDRIEVELTPRQIEELVRALNGMTLDCARRAVTYAILADGKLSNHDIQSIQQHKVELVRRGGLLEYLPHEHNSSQLGGFSNLKQWLSRARVGFTKTAKALNLSPPRGICIVGVQGCGKSLAVKAIAREWQLPLLKLDAGRIYDKYIGESEKNFRKAIAMAESMSPAVLWIDEIEKAISTGGGGGEESGLSKRLLGNFLTWLQEKKEAVFVVATANNLSVLPPELLRKGRFDEIFFVDLPTEEERAEILRIHLTLRKQSVAEFDLPQLVEATAGFSGAEIEQAIVSGLYESLYVSKPFTTDLLLREIWQTVPLSISRKEDVEQLQRTARGRFVSVR